MSKRVYYGIVTGNISTVMKNWSDVEEARTWSPYARFKKFYNEEDAWTWVKKQPLQGYGDPSTLKYYGEIDKNSPHIEIQYQMLEDSCVYVLIMRNTNFKLNVGQLRSDTLVQTKRGCYIVTIEGLQLKKEKIKHHFIALNAILKIVGSSIDCVINLPYGCLLYYILEKSGSVLYKRIGRLSFNVERFVLTEEKQNEEI